MQNPNRTEDEITEITDLTNFLLATIRYYREEEHDCSEQSVLDAVEAVLGILLAKAIPDHGSLDWYLSVIFNRLHAQMQYQHTGQHAEKARGPVMSFAEYRAARKRVMARHGVTDRASEDAFAKRGGFGKNAPGLWKEICEEHAAIVNAQGAA